jgi:hypothetical protein
VCSTGTGQKAETESKGNNSIECAAVIKAQGVELRCEGVHVKINVLILIDTETYLNMKCF